MQSRTLICCLRLRIERFNARIVSGAYGRHAMLRDLRGRFMHVMHDPERPWVLIDPDLRQPVLRCATRAECREWQRVGGGTILRTHGERRRGCLP